MKAGDACRAADQWRLRKIEELARIGPLVSVRSRAEVFSSTGSVAYPAAAQAFRDYVSESTDGRFALRARNYLVTALARASEEP